MFHMTLLYEMQLLDELPMVWGSSYMVYCLYKVQIEPHQKTPKMAFAMISYSMAVTIVYLIGMFICLLFINSLNGPLRGPACLRHPSRLGVFITESVKSN